MDIKQYQIEAEATKSNKFYCPWEFNFKLNSAEIEFTCQQAIDIHHAITGLSTEGGEMLGVIKAAQFYNRPVDIINLDEEIGDMLWYIALYCNARNTTFEKIAALNNKKLKARFPEKFTEFGANNRDLKNERKILEEGSDETKPG